MSESRMTRVRHELLTDIADQVAEILRDSNIEPDKATQLGIDVSNHLAEHWGGQLITFPKDRLFKITQRDLQMYNEFTGRNIHELARKYGISENGVYKAIKRIRDQAISERQPGLFE